MQPAAVFICTPLAAVCSVVPKLKHPSLFDAVAVCIRDARTAVSGGQVSKKLSYKDQVVELTYEGGSRCAANPELKHKTVIHFICR